MHTCYSPVRRSPAAEASFSPAAPRLACVKPVASVHPEPGSNSSLLLILFSFFQNLNKARINYYCLSQATKEYLMISRRDSASFIECLLRRIDLRLALDRCCRSANALVLLLVYCNRFNVLFSHCSPREAFSRKRLQSYGVYFFPPNVFAILTSL